MLILKNLVLGYFNIRTYLLISILIFFLLIMFNNFREIDFDITEVLKEFRKNIEDIREISLKLANLIEYIVEEALQGNRLPAYIFIFTICLIPILRLLILKNLIKEIIIKK